MLSAGTPSELSFELLRTNSNLQEPNILFILEIDISSSPVFSQQSPKPSGKEFALTKPLKRNPFPRNPLCSAAAAIFKSGLPGEAAPAPCRKEITPPEDHPWPWTPPVCTVSSPPWTMGP